MSDVISLFYLRSYSNSNFWIYLQRTNDKFEAILEGCITGIHASHLTVKIKDEQDKTSPAPISDVQFLKQFDRDVRMPYSLIRNGTSATQFRIGQNIFLKFVRKDVKNNNNIYIGSTDKFNFLTNDQTEVNASFKNLEKRDDWSVNTWQADENHNNQKNNASSIEKGISTCVNRCRIISRNYVSILQFGHLILPFLFLYIAEDSIPNGSAKLLKKLLTPVKSLKDKLNAKVSDTNEKIVRGSCETKESHNHLR